MAKYLTSTFVSDKYFLLKNKIMKNFCSQNLRVIILTFLTFNIISTQANAQCSVTGIPAYSSTCSAEYFTTMSASGTSVVSTIALSGGTCGSTTYFNRYATQGINVAPGNIVHINFTRYTTTYTGYLSVYVDWNNDGIYETTELSGTILTMPSSVLTATYNFLVPATGITTGVNLHMRVMLSELATGAPCTASFGQTYDYYLQAGCITGGTISVTPSSGSFCSGGTGITFTGTGAGTGGTYEWTPAAGLSATSGATVIASPSVTTVYTITGTPAGGCGSTTTASVTVNPLPTASVSASGPLNLCTGDSVTLSAPLIAGNTYQWFLVTTALTGATNNTFTASASGNYTVKVTNSYGCSATSAVFIVSVSTVVPVSDTFSGPLKICSGDSLTLRATSGSGFSYQWKSGGSGITGATSSRYIVHTSGSYLCEITVPSGCTESTNIATVTVNPLPVPAVTFDGKTFHTASYYSSYQWYENGTLITGATHDTVLAHSNGNYTVKVTDTNGCAATSNVYDLANVGVTNINTASYISIYPNPAGNFVNITSPVPVNVHISGPDGKYVIMQKNIRQVDISSLPSGIYLVELSDDQGHRLLIQKLSKN